MLSVFPVKAINTKTGEVFVFNRSFEAQRAGYVPQSIIRVCAGVDKLHRGLKWESVNPIPDLEFHRERLLSYRKKIKSYIRGNWEWFFERRWSSIKNRTVNGGGRSNYKNDSNNKYIAKGIRLELTREEFKTWCYEHREEIAQMEKDGLRPSIDRIDPTGNYSGKNIRVYPLLDNIRDGVRRNAQKRSKPIYGVHRDNPENIKKFKNTHEAGRCGFCRVAILDCLKGRAPTHKGYRWYYDKKE